MLRIVNTGLQAAKPDFYVDNWRLPVQYRQKKVRGFAPHCAAFFLLVPEFRRLFPLLIELFDLPRQASTLAESTASRAFGMLPTNIVVSTVISIFSQ